jgi:Gamma tubulin complex component N-terminal/Gamma tubulin complex component C-terminal
MLHEILLSLSGHPSPLFDERSPSGVDGSFPLLSPPEKALLSSISRLSHLHRDLRTHTSQISVQHQSTICRAVATSIQTTQLGRFQRKILEVEERVLKRDPSCVGAYNIVPLAGVVSEFDEWTRLMEWYWELSCFMLPLSAPSPASGGCSGSALIDKLRQEAQTGYQDIEEAALSLSKEAEKAWMRQLSTWVLYGRLPTHRGQDFFIRAVEDTETRSVDFESDTRLLPKFVSTDTAASMVFIGKSLNLIRSRGILQDAPGGSAPSSELDLLKNHLQYLAEIVLPISSAALSRAIAEIRLSFSRNTLQQLLPLPKIVQILALLREFFLLGRGEFAMALIAEADDRLRSRNRSQSGLGDLKGLLLKEAEVNAVLSKTWSALAAIGNAEDYTDDNLELARDTIHLTTAKIKLIRPSTPSRAKGSEFLPRLTDTNFNDALLSVPTSLVFDIPSPFDLFMTSAELNMYSALHAYLLAIRRAHIHLSELWRESYMRRVHPTHPGPPHSGTSSGQERLKLRRVRANRRNVEMRKVWATCSAAIFLLAEMGEHFEGQVVNEAWEHLKKWLLARTKRKRPSEQLSHSVRTDHSVDELSTSLRSSTISHSGQIGQDAPARDPEMLASAHRRFLSSLANSLLITDALFTRLLRTLLANIDALVAYIHRLQVIQQNLDLEEDEDIVDPLANYEQEQKEVTLELDRSRKRVDSDMKAIVARLRELDMEELGGRLNTKAKAEGEFEPWRGPGIERLLMKLDFGAAPDDEDEEDGFRGRGLV